MNARGFLAGAVAVVLLSSCSTLDVKADPGVARDSGSTSVFVIGGIHQSHEKAEKYTYERMGEIFEQLRPEVLCVEVEQRFLDDQSEKGMPFDFKRFMLPAARRRNVEIIGIDWVDPARHVRWQSLQGQIVRDPSLGAQVSLYGGLFGLLNQYFRGADFLEINSEAISGLWRAMDKFKVEVLSRNPKYAPVVEYEHERNQHMSDNVVRVIRRNPDKRILVAVGIAHKYFMEEALRQEGIRVLRADEVLKEWAK